MVPNGGVMVNARDIEVSRVLALPKDPGAPIYNIWVHFTRPDGKRMV